MCRKYSVYKGEQNGQLVYIGTTIQEPSARFRWHKANGKPFKFTVIAQFNSAKEMLDEEYRLIQLYKPKHNKITHRKQNFNVKLTTDQLQSRVGDKEWCQVCLKRRVNLGYSACLNCA